MALVEIRNNERDRKIIPIPVLGPDGKQARDAKGKLVESEIVLGSTLDAAAGEGVPKPVIRMDEKTWDGLSRSRTIAGWTRDGNISVFNVRT